MALKHIAKQVAFYLQKSRTSFIVDNVDMLVMALNNARKAAEQMHAFHANQVQVDLVVDSLLGASLSSAVLAGTATPVSVKSVETVYIQAHNNAAHWYPVWIDPKKVLAVRDKGELGGTPFNRYNSDLTRVSQQSPYNVYFHGQTIQFNPAHSSAVNIRLDAQRWMQEYTPNIIEANSYASSILFLTETPPANVIIDHTTVSELSRVVSDKNSISITFSEAPSPEPNPTVEIPIFYTYQTRDSAITLDAHRVNEDYTDWMIEHGAEYLIHAAICELNLFAKQFVNRDVGYISPPEKARDKALARLIEWDDYQWDQGLQPLRA